VITDRDLNVVARSTNATANPGANTNRTFVFATPWTVPIIDPAVTWAFYYVGFNVTGSAGTYSMLSSNGLGTQQVSIPPALLGTSNTAQTTLPAIGTVLNPVTALASPGLFAWALTV
jgi:hypothetical protein